MAKLLFLRAFPIILLLFLFGCNPNHLIQAESELQAKSDREGFIEPDSSDWAKYIVPVREYLYYRTKAVLSGDIHVLWERYPRLKTDIDPKNGINSEQVEVESLNEHFALIDANFNAERYERIKVKPINENEAIVLVHGIIVYLRDNFDETGGEILIKLYLEKEGDRWSVVKTDEYTLPEYKEWLRAKNMTKS